jgi:hypothetical protein
LRLVRKHWKEFATDAILPSSLALLSAMRCASSREEVCRRAERRDHGLLRRNRDGVATMFEMFGQAGRRAIEFAGDGVEQIAQFDQPPIGARSSSAITRSMRARSSFSVHPAGTRCLLDHAAKVAAIALGLNAKLASPRQLPQLGDVGGDAPGPVLGDRCHAQLRSRS